jgi:hypothetical protein
MLTFHGELLLDVLEVVGVLAVDRAVGSLNRHLGDTVLVVTGKYMRLLVDVARYEYSALCC